ncbi:MAG TPA: transposase [Herpetosiphonaceae bacterium]
MIGQETLLVTLVRFVDRVPMLPLPKRGPGRPNVYTDRLFLKAVVIMLVRHLHTVHELLSVLAQPTSEMICLRQLLTVNGQFPSRRTWERRLHALPVTLPAQIACLGRVLVSVIQPWARSGRAVAVESTLLRARGGVWHQKDRAANTVPHTSIDTEAHWTKSGWHGWVYGWKLHLAATVAAVWIPLAAELTTANTADSERAPALICALPADVRVVLGDRHYNTPDLHAVCAEDERLLITSRYGRYPHRDGGVEVRRIFHKLRSSTIENFNEQFKGMFDGHGQVPTKGLTNTRRFVLGAIVVYQLLLWYRWEHGLDLRVGLKACLKAA